MEVAGATELKMRIFETKIMMFKSLLGSGGGIGGDNIGKGGGIGIA